VCVSKMFDKINKQNGEERRREKEIEYCD